MNFLKQNWFKLAILLILVGVSIGFFNVFPRNKTTPTPQATESTAPAVVDSVVKLEICRTQAKDYADKIAKRDYLLAFEKASNAGDEKTAQAYLEMSFKPEHPANYDSNYNSEYIKCLKQ